MEGRVHVRRAPDAHSGQVVLGHARDEGLERAAGAAELYQITAFAPDFAQALNLSYPNPAEISKTYTIPISASLKDATEITITIGLVSAQVIYHYRRG